MEENKLLSLPDTRQLIHELVAIGRQTGLSPPEQVQLSELEGREAETDSADDDIPPAQSIPQVPGVLHFWGKDLNTKEIVLL